MQAATLGEINEAAQLLDDGTAASQEAALHASQEALLAFAEGQAAKDRELLAALQARPKAAVDELRLRLGTVVTQRPNRATRRAMEKAARRSPRRGR